MIYRRLIRPFLYLLSPEVAHHLAMMILRFFCFFPGIKLLLRKIFVPNDACLKMQVWDRQFPCPVGLAAGFDKDATSFEALGATGFGFIEVGTLTGEPQPGNPKPRLFRLVKDRALINRMGFNNRGSANAVRRLARKHKTIVGINIGKTKLVPEEDAIRDYVKSAERLGPYADYMVVNVSSPNTPGLRDLQSVEKLKPLLLEVRKTLNKVSLTRHVPLLVKIAPDLSNEDIDAIADMAIEIELDGMIAVNTTIQRQGLQTSNTAVEAIGAGGLSGPILSGRAMEVLRRLRARAGFRMVVISAGGIETAEEAYQRIRAGANLIQIYTSYIYQGPLLPMRLNKKIARLAQQDGFHRVQDAIGVDA